MEMVACDMENVPEALMARDQWVCWRREERDGKATKVPVEPATGGYASTTEPGTWTDIETVVDAVSTTDADGVGFVFTDEDALVGVDLDDCRDPDGGRIDEWARDIITRLDSYAEVSPSGTGVHVIVAGELPAGRSRSGDVEMYETHRFFTVTGAHLDRTPAEVQQRDEAIREVHREFVQEPAADVGDATSEATDSTKPRAGPASKRPNHGIDLSDEELLDRARDAANGDRFDALWRGQTTGYNSHSEADMALCLHLAFWTGGDPGRMDRLFRESGLMREKWDEVHYADGATYGERTIERALEVVDDVYEPAAKEVESGSSTIDNETFERGVRDPASATQGEAAQREIKQHSIYLEERARLLVETVREQRTTIEQQARRIDRLEEELDRLRESGSVHESAEGGPPAGRGPLIRLREWLAGR